MAPNTRALTLDDFAALLELAEVAEAEGFRFVRRFVNELAAAKVQLSDPGEFFLGISVGDELIGIGGVTPDPYIADAHVGRLRHLFVRREQRARGAGRALVAALEAGAQRCYTQLRLRTDTAVAAHFYERLGYSPISDGSATHVRDLASGARAGNLTMVGADGHDRLDALPA